jgi:hypothetical protein
VTHDYLQWLRFVQVVIGKDGRGLDLRSSHDDGLRIEATVEKTLTSTPDTMDVTIYNLPREEEDWVRSLKDGEVLLSAGYAKRIPTEQDNASDPSLYNVLLVLRGDLKNALGYQAGASRKFEVQAADGHRAFRNSVVSTMLDAGYTDADVVRAALKGMAGLKAGSVATSPRKHLRGKVLMGPAREALDRVAANNDGFWSMQNGVLHVVPSSGLLPTEAIVLNYETGLLDAPEVSDKGIMGTCLLNPLMVPNGVVWLDNSQLKTKSVQLYTNGPKIKERNLVEHSADGFYKLIAVRHDLDSRGSAKTSFTCIAPGTKIPSAEKKKT